jgi:hypothetical protein
MKWAMLIMLGWMLSNCAAVKMITGHSIQAQDVITSINTVNNLAKYSEPAAREELDREVRAWLKQRENQ